MIFLNIKTIEELKDAIIKATALLIKDEKLDNESINVLKTFEFNVEELQINSIKARQRAIPNLVSKGHGYVNYMGGELAKGCQICLFGTGMSPVNSASECNLRCEFCYYNNVHDKDKRLLDGHFLIGGREIDLDMLKIIADKQLHKLDGICWVYKEPFTCIEKHYEPIAYAHSKGTYQWMYTNGTLCTKENLDLLAESGLDELRFDLAATLCSDKVLDMMEYAVEVFPSVGIESPMYEEFFESFIEKKDRIVNSGIDFINCAELHHSENNIDLIKANLLQFYRYKEGYISPLSSRHYTYDLMDIAYREDWKFTIHDCSNQTKVFRGFNKEFDVGDLSYGKETLPLSWYQEVLFAYPYFFEDFLDN